MLAHLLCSILVHLSVFSFTPEKSSVTFEISNFGVNTVEGSFSNLQGIVEFDPKALEKTKIALKVPVSTISTGIEKRDEHLQAPEYFDAQKYPYLQFKSSEVKRVNSQLIIRGTLTVKGISKVIEVPATYNQSGLTCSFTLDRYAFKVGDSGSFTIGREVNVHVYLSF